MNNSLKEIQSPVSSHLDIFEKKFKDSMKSNVLLLDKITRFMVKRKGKQMRPLFVFLCSELCGSINDKTYRAAVLIELLHSATLIHDDVVDDANERRSFFTINALWKNKAAVLVGDFLLSRGMLFSVENRDYELLEIVSEAVKDMSEGELLQIEKARSLNLDEKIYFEIIRKKTASLLSSCCACGAASVSEDEALINKMKLFGEKIGIAFQIKDDLFDYQKNNTSGKAYGVDIKEKKMTLPIIYMLNNMSYLDRKQCINIIKNKSNNPEKVSEIIEKVNKSGGIKYAQKQMEEYTNEALQLLSEFPDSRAKQSLEQLVLYTIKRER